MEWSETGALSSIYSMQVKRLLVLSVSTAQGLYLRWKNTRLLAQKKNENKLKMNIEFPGILVNIFDEGRNSLSLLLFLLIIRVANLYSDHQGRRPNNEDRAAHRTVSCPWEGVRPVHIFTVRTIFKQIHTSCLCLKFPYKRFWTGTAATLLLIGSKITFLR